ncbi:MAG: MurR/RpiR family transcriptional regulator [Rhodospirillaceae bacterium]|nr:MurR/RpiR family transcriptional regulator [Rhodospirillaceae bacterium]
MDRGPLTERIIEEFDGMPPQLQSAARYVLDRPSDVALLSMREQARRAGVQPATMTRLAKRLGLDGYESLRSLYADAIRESRLGFAGRAGVQVASQKARGDRALAADMVASLTRQIETLSEPRALAACARAAERLAGAERIYCLGLRACYPIAWNLHYVLSLLGERTLLLDGAAGTGADHVRAATPRDVLFVASIRPYTRATIEISLYAHGRGVPIVAVTDSRLSPLARIAREIVLIPTDGPSFFHTLTPAFVVGEILAALVAGRGGEASLEALRRTEAQLAAFNTHWLPADARRAR